MDSIINMINEYSILIIIALAVITLLLFIITMLLLASVKKLEKRGLIQQRTRGENLKIKEWELTEKGKQIYPFILGEHLYSETTALKGFSKEEVAQLEEYLIRVRENITLDWELVKKGQKRNYSEVKQ